MFLPPVRIATLPTIELCGLVEDIRPETKYGFGYARILSTPLRALELLRCNGVSTCHLDVSSHPSALAADDLSLLPAYLGSQLATLYACIG